MPWAPCDHQGYGPQCTEGYAGRISTFLILAAMRQRADRIAIPLISSQGGVVVSPTVPFRCAFGDDADTWRAEYGCYDSWCDRRYPSNRGRDGGGMKPEWRVPCGLGPRGSVHTNWGPADLDMMISLYLDKSQPYKSPSFYSGYNELVYSSSKWNDHLPNTIEAFFVIPSAGDWNAIFATQKRHRSFLYTYSVHSSQVPLIAFDPSNFDAPFKLYACQEFCSSWRCDGSPWCAAGQVPEDCWGC